MTMSKMEELVKKAARGVWQQIQGDAANLSSDGDGIIDLDEAVELCLDADRPVTFGFMTKEQYDEVCKLNFRIVDEWASQALKGLVD